MILYVARMYAETSSEPPYWARVVLHGTDKLLVQELVSFGEPVSSAQGSIHYSQPLGRFISNEVNMKQPDKSTYLASPPESELRRAIGLAPQTDLLVGA